MNKTVNINLGGTFFHIDEDAYQKLSRYFEAIKRSLSDSSGKDEIMKDIEMRIAEILLEKQSSDKQVVGLRDVEQVIGIMGQPEDYRLEDEETAHNEPFFRSGKTRKKLYRDEDKKTFGGVAVGLSHYLGIDAVWIKIIMILITIASFGTGILIYLILWIVTPGAKTTAEKLEMTGEPVNISNIERKVREEFESVADRVKNADYNKMGNQVKSGADKVATGVMNVVSKIFRLIAKIIGAFIATFSAILLLSAIIALLTFGSTSFFNVPLDSFMEVFNYSETPLWLLALAGFLMVSIPLFFLFLLGMNLLIDNLKSIGNFTRYTLLAVWLAACVFFIAFAIRQSYEIKEEGKSIKKEELQLVNQDTLAIKFGYNDLYANDLFGSEDMKFVSDPSGKEMIYSTDVMLEILPTDAKKPYISIEKRARGINMSDARSRSEKIEYQYKLDGNTLTLDNYFLADTKLKYRKQKVVVYLYIPKGMYLKPDSSLQYRDYSDDDYFNLLFSGNYIYRVDADKIRCVTCPKEEMDHNDVDIEWSDSSGSNVQVKVSSLEKAVEIKTDSIGKKNLKSLIINKDGIVVKAE